MKEVERVQTKTKLNIFSFLFFVSFSKPPREITIGYCLTLLNHVPNFCTKVTNTSHMITKITVITNSDRKLFCVACLHYYIPEAVDRNGSGSESWSRYDMILPTISIVIACIKSWPLRLFQTPLFFMWIILFSYIYYWTNIPPNCGLLYNEMFLF